MNISLKKFFVVANIIFVLYFLTLQIGLGDYLNSLFVNILMYALPGLCWIGLLKNRIDDHIANLFWIFTLSTSVHLFVHVVHLIVGVDPNPYLFLLVIAIISNIGIYISRPHQVFENFKFPRMQVVILSLASLCVFSCLYSGMKTLPEQIDLDGEHQGTVYGFMHELKPYLTSDIVVSPYYFAHPPLSNLYNAYSAFYLNKADDYKFYYDTAKTAERVLALDVNQRAKIRIGDVEHVIERQDHQYFVIQESRGESRLQIPYMKDRMIERLSEEDQNEFYRRPRVFPTRVSNLFAGVMTYLVLFQLIVVVTNSRLLGFVGGFVFIFSPGIFVRTCFSEHVAFTNCIMAMLAYQYFRPEAFTFKSKRRVSWAAYIPGVIAGLINQKIVILIVPLFLLEVFKRFRNMSKSPADTQPSAGLAIVTGFTIGTLVFWLYGLLVDQQAFIISHLQSHLFDRVLHRNTMFADDYPGLIQLWREFFKEFPLFWLALFGIVCNLKNIFSKRIVFLLMWAVFGAISFSLVDWKQTNHLMLIIIPLIVLLMNYIEQHKIGYKRCLKILVGLCLLYSFWIDLQLMQDFTYYMPTSGW